jgi:CheY-like chemotaxis protein
MDMSLSVVDGWEATRRLKADHGTRAIPVIGLTAHAMAGDREKVIEAGCDDYDTQEFGASVAAIAGFVEILIEDAGRHELEGYLPDLERMRSAATQLSSLVTQAVDAFGRGRGVTATLSP